MSVTSTETATEDAGILLEQIAPGLSGKEIQLASRLEESIETVRFMFHAWCSIPNITVSGFRFGIQYMVLKRMTLIPLKSWQVPKIIPRTQNSGFGGISGNFAYPTSAVGTIVEQHWQFPQASANLLLQAYGIDGVNNIGMVELKSLAADTDAKKVESALLFHALMMTKLNPEDPTCPIGTEVLIEDIPKFLQSNGVQLLKRAFNKGIVWRQQPYRFQSDAKRKGEMLIEDLLRSAEAARFRALDESTGILPETKRQLASKGDGDKKVTDRLDSFLLLNFPSFSLDTDVERAARATQSVTNAIRSGTTEQGENMQHMMEMHQQTMNALAESNRVNNELVKLLAARSENPVPPGQAA